MVQLACTPWKLSVITGSIPVHALTADEDEDGRQEALLRCCMSILMLNSSTFTPLKVFTISFCSVASLGRLFFFLGTCTIHLSFLQLTVISTVSMVTHIIMTSYIQG